MFVCVFTVIWFFSTRHYKKPKQYSIVVDDVFGKENAVYGLKSDFKTKDVSTSFIKGYLNRFSQYSFSLTSNFP